MAVRAAMNGSEAGRLQERAAGVRRLRRHRAGAQVGRLQGRGPEGQAGGGADQRSRLRDRRRRIRRQGHDLLRPLDLQVRRDGAPRRAGHHHRARNRAGLVWLEHGQELQHQRHVRHRAQAAEGSARADGGVDTARPGGRPVQARRPGFRGVEKAGADAQLQAGRAEGRDLVGALRGRCAGHHLEERGGPRRRQPGAEKP
jgi:hypothetical protein